MPFPSLLRRQEPSLKRSFSCRAGSCHQNGNNQIFDFIGIYYFQKYVKTSKALLCTGRPPERVRQIFGFAKVSAFLSQFVANVAVAEALPVDADIAAESNHFE